MSAAPVSTPSAAENVAGLLSASSIFTSLISLAWHPLRLVLIAILLALVAAAIGGRHARLAAVAVAVGGVCFFGGMAIAIVTSNPIW